MTVLDGYGGYIVRCDRCQKVSNYHDNEDGSRNEEHESLWKITEGYWHSTIFYRRKMPNVFYNKDWCLECAKAVTPIVWQLRDIGELSMYVNKLKKAIRDYEKHQNDGTA